MDKILVIGACGQLGGELTVALRKVYGTDNVIAADVRAPEEGLADGPFSLLNVLDINEVAHLVKAHAITQVYQLAAILSAKGEEEPMQTWQLNMEGLLHVLEIAREKKILKIFWPSSIAVFGDHTPKKNTPQFTVTDPATVYGISKLAGERWCAYYFRKYGVDIRSLRYPGLIGYKSLAGGGTTDFAVDIYFKAAQNEPFNCFVAENTHLPMMYMEDAVRATLELMDAEATSIKVRGGYNIGAMSLSPGEMVQSIRKYIPDFSVSYAPDYRQSIADAWPDSIDDREARADWEWQPQYDLDRMTEDMLKHLKKGSLKFYPGKIPGL
jgi:nucleoside-diphosphate-sugar epimerase